MGRVREQPEAAGGDSDDELHGDQDGGRDDRRERGAALRAHGGERYCGCGREARLLRAARIPTAIRRPPASSTGESVSESSATAIAAARNGWRLAARVARAGPIRSSARNQSSFVTTSGPSTANAKSSQTVQPRPQSWLES